MRPLKADPAKDPTLDYERELWAAGAPVVIGIDEVGRGAVAGPVAVGAHAVLPSITDIPAGLRDSKLLSEARRTFVAPLLTEWGVGAVGYASAAEIDERGITATLGEAARRALLSLHEQGVDVTHAVIILDGSQDWLTPVLKAPLDIRTRIGADRLCASVAAASVGAKVARDQLMCDADEAHPEYAWASNKGYGSAAHYAGIAAHGLTELHRHTWIKA
ncbi:ribonuclease HII [Leucobacter exalbidus]|uniref:Ribonuclease n=1 Tax=Leucobacter exalbidus TaxID=662960 RepID=A0A940PTE6_9MICO|nr:ribonuclease HII [Leucobacter exalbidus]MBP1324906.1 ribonuclease HII [Leucobacter exalbidus]